MALIRLRRALALSAALALPLVACGDAEPRGAARPSAPSTTTGSAATPTAAPTVAAQAPVPDAGAVEVVTTGLEVPWGIGFLPDGDALVTERDTARVLRVPAEGGRAREVARVREARPGGEGGLLGLAVSPTFPQDDLVYVYVTTGRDNRVLRFPLSQPTRTETVLTGIPKARVHNGGRIAFGPDGDLYVGTGDAGDTSLSQDPGSLGGKVLRVDVGTGDAAVHSSGHRNVQGLAFDRDGRLWATEFGQNRFDEVNLLQQGRNYGWPEVEGPGDDGGRFVAPQVTWSTDEASPSGAAVAAGSLYVAALRGERLWRVPLDGDRAGEPEALLQGDFGRLRAAHTAPDGSLWVLTSNRDGRGDPDGDDDRVLRLPAR